MSESVGRPPTVPSGCPVADWFNPVETSAHSDPFPWYAKARKAGSVFYAPSVDMYVASRYEEVTEVLRDAITYSNADGLGPKMPGPERPLPPDLVEEMGDEWDTGMSNALTVLDPPRQTRIRKLVGPLFTPRSMRQYEGLIRDVANRRIDQFEQAGHADLAQEFAYKIPNQIIGRILGMPEDAADKFVEWLEAYLDIFTGVSGEDATRAWRLLFEQHQFTREFIEQRRANPTDDLVSHMIRAKADDGSQTLTDEEILGNAIGFIGAGSETSSILMVHAVYLLLTHPEQWRAVKTDPDLIPVALEETLRLRGPARGVVRIVTKEVTLGGVDLPKGSKLYLNLVSASNDEGVFDRPEEFNIHRSDLDKHLGFGKWAHFCIGAPLARLEGRVALECLIERLPDMDLAPDQGALNYGDSTLTPPVEALRVEW